jgi:hypothetical protein
MPPPAQVSTVYATDESIAVRAAGDFPTLCPPWQYLASATDGVFSSGTPWVLSSASSNFTAAGIAANHVVWLKKTGAYFTGSGVLYAVESVSTTTLTLRMIGQASGVGLAPGPSAGLTSVNFVVPTLYPQIEEASFAINRQYAIDPNITGRAPSNIYDLRDLRMACILKVLLTRLDAEVQQKDTSWSLKREQYGADLSLVMDRLQVRWGPKGLDQAPSSFFSTRLVR